MQLYLLASSKTLPENGQVSKFKKMNDINEGGIRGRA